MNYEKVPTIKIPNLRKIEPELIELSENPKIQPMNPSKFSAFALFQSEPIEETSEERKKRMEEFLIRQRNRNARDLRDDHVCVTCAEKYIEHGSIGMEVMGDAYCEKHNWRFPFYDNNIKVLCIKCAKEENVCRHCGEKIEEQWIYEKDKDYGTL